MKLAVVPIIIIIVRTQVMKKDELNYFDNTGTDKKI